MAGDTNSIKDIQFNIENLLSQDNLMEPDSLKSLQGLLNRYVFGRQHLTPDGVLGAQTLKGIQTYRNEKKYWGGDNLNISIDPLETSKEYDASMKAPSGQ